jgi:hypothetical protein
MAAGELGLRQLLDLGTGLPTAANLHDADLRDAAAILTAISR